jgi:hypothetical protein
MVCRGIALLGVALHLNRLWLRFGDDSQSFDRCLIVMSKNASFELLSSLKGLRIRTVTQTELGWVVEAEGAVSLGILVSAIWDACKALIGW